MNHSKQNGRLQFHLNLLENRIKKNETASPLDFEQEAEILKAIATLIEFLAHENQMFESNEEGE